MFKNKAPVYMKLNKFARCCNQLKLTITWPEKLQSLHQLHFQGIPTIAKLKPLFQSNFKYKSKNNGTAKYSTIWHIQKVMALPGNQNNN